VIAALSFVFSFLYATMLEYVVHRWVMHRPWRVLSMPFRTHTRFHHRIFHGAGAYHVQQKEDGDHIRLFKNWQACLWLGAHVPALWGLQWASSLPVFYGGMLGLAVYTVLYEYLHWFMHSPAGRWVERTRVFRVLDTHHRLHHQLWSTNFNLMLPLGDIVFGTFQRARQTLCAMSDSTGALGRQ